MGKKNVAILTKYNYEKDWILTKDVDLLRIIIDEIGDVDPEGTLKYIKEAVENKKIINIGSCKFKGAEL